MLALYSTVPLETYDVGYLAPALMRQCIQRSRHGNLNRFTHHENHKQVASSPAFLLNWMTIITCLNLFVLASLHYFLYLILL